MSWARIQFERKQINKVLRRCKNSSHGKTQRAAARDERRLNGRDSIVR